MAQYIFDKTRQSGVTRSEPRRIATSAGFQNQDHASQSKRQYVSNLSRQAGESCVWITYVQRMATGKTSCRTSTSRRCPVRHGRCS